MDPSIESSHQEEEYDEEDYDEEDEEDDEDYTYFWHPTENFADYGVTGWCFKKDVLISYISIYPLFLGHRFYITYIGSEEYTYCVEVNSGEFGTDNRIEVRYRNQDKVYRGHNSNPNSLGMEFSHNHYKYGKVENVKKAPFDIPESTDIAIDLEAIVDFTYSDIGFIRQIMNGVIYLDK